MTLNFVIETVMQLPHAQQEMLLEIIDRRHVEQRRKEMAQDAQTTLAAFRLGQFSPQPVQAVIDELRAALHEPDENDQTQRGR